MYIYIYDHPIIIPFRSYCPILYPMRNHPFPICTSVCLLEELLHRSILPVCLVKNHGHVMDTLWYLNGLPWEFDGILMGVYGI